MENNSSQNRYREEIEQRENILNKVRNGIKLSHDERVWLLTHPVYNARYGINAYNIAIEHLEPSKWFRITIRVESILYNDRIIPIIYAPTEKSKIVSDLELYNHSGKQKQTKTVKMLGFEVSENIKDFEVDFFSVSGILSVQYECNYFDVKQNLNMREASSTGNPDFAMIRQIIDNDTVRYYCKAPCEDSFDAMVFSVHWEEKDKV